MEAWEELQDVVGPIIDRVCADDVESPEAGLARLSEKERTLYLTWCVGGEVDNGGFAQFFCNSNGGFAKETADALDKVGCKEVADMVRKSMTAFPGGKVPTDIGERNMVLSNFPAESSQLLDALDKEFYAFTSDRVLQAVRDYWVKSEG